MQNDPTIRVTLFKRGAADFLMLLSEHDVPRVERRSGTVSAAGYVLEVVTAIGQASVLPSLAFALRAWLNRNASREVQLQTRDRQVIQLKGMSQKEMESWLEKAESLNLIQTKDDDDE